jgi:chromosomal replication initiator protein
MSQNISTIDISSDPKLIWKECLNIIKENVPFLTYNTWFLPIKPYELVSFNLKISVPNDYFVEWIEEHFNTLLNKTIKQVLGDEGTITYIISEDDDEPIINITETVHEKAPPAQSVKEEAEKLESYLNPKYLFDNFIKGEGNELARAAAYAVSENPGQTSFNPLFIYGGVGLGKTHLIHAIGNKILEKDPSKRVIYLSTDVFTVEFVEAVQSNTINDFSNYYKSMDTLIIDDIQFLVGKEKTQDLFFNIFNTLHQSGRQIILSSDKPPKDLKGLNERLISRFSWGLTTDIQPPDLETRIAILKNKSEIFGIKLAPDILEYIANNITSNIRELEGCLIKLLANASLNGRKIDFELARKTVKEISSTKKINISIDYITKIVCEYFEVEENKVREKNRKKEVVEARQVAMYLSKILTKSSLKTIGLHFGGRDHSTVLHAHKSVETGVSTDPKIKEVVDTIKNKIELGAA